MNEVQLHGFQWEKDILLNVYGATKEELASIKYNSTIDLPAAFNRLEKCALSIKTSGSLNTVCMADCLHFYDSVNGNNPLHMVLVNYTQNGDIKRLSCITEIDLTASHKILFNIIDRSQIEFLVKEIKAIPTGRKPNDKEYANMYNIRNELQKQSGVIKFNIKCDSKNQRRLQCSFTSFQEFLKNHKERIIAQSYTNQFRGGIILSEIISRQRVFNNRI
jgi:hypothetical protein